MRTKFTNLLNPALLIAAVMCCFLFQSCMKDVTVVEKQRTDIKIDTFYIYKTIDKDGKVHEVTTKLKLKNGEKTEVF